MGTLSLENYAHLAVIFQTVVMTFAVAVALYQIRVTKKEAAKWRTIEACERYDVDPILDSALRNLHSSRLDGTLDASLEKLKPDLTTVLNYLDGIAIGIAQGVLIEDIVKDQMEPIFRSHFEKYFTDRMMEGAGLDKGHFGHLVALMSKWNGRPAVNFKER
jgi:hypothetical protein